MTYDEASREVVAEAMTDILPDANFVEELATKHKAIFTKLLEKLKEFVSELKTYFNSLLNNRSREANALKEQVGESVKYIENIVKLFDKVAVEAVENYQATVATAVETKNTDGGIENAEQQTERNKRTETIHTGRNSSVEGSQNGTREEDGDRPRVQGIVGEKEKNVQGYNTVQRQSTGIKAPVENAWILDSNNYIVPAQGSDLHKAQNALTDEHGIECHIVKASAWKNEAMAFTYHKKVYICENIDEVDLRAAPYHEATHVLKQRGFKPYLDFVNRTPDMLNTSTQEYQQLMDMVAEHLGYDILNMNEAQFIRFYDELNATVCGWAVSGLIFEAKYDAEWITNAFSDFDAYINELTGIHEQFKKENAPKKEVNTNVEETGTVLPHRSDGERDTRLLAESQAEDVSGDGAERNAVDNSRKRGDEAGRPDNRADAERAGRRPSKRNSKSADIRRDDGLTTEVQKDIADQEKLIAEPFANQAELDQKRTRYNEVMEMLNPKEEQSLDSVDEDKVQEQSRAYLNSNKENTNEREETRDNFYRRSDAEIRTVRERGQTAYGYRAVLPKHISRNSKAFASEVKKYGIQAVVHDGLELDHSQ